MMCGEIAGTFFFFKIFQYVLVWLAPTTQFDTSTALLIRQLSSSLDGQSWVKKRLWDKLLSWDAVYFIKNMVNGEYEFEHEYAFSSVWPKFVRLCCRGNFEFYHILKTAIFLENLLHFISVILLYILTLKTFEKNILKTHQRYELARKSAVLFILTGAAGFFTGIYSEPLSSVLSFAGILAREYSIFHDVYGNVICKWQRWPLYSLVSTICFMVAFANRSNCILLGIFYIMDLLSLLRRRKIAQATFFPLLSGIALLLFVIFQHYYVPYKAFCPQRGGWCKDKIRMLPFTYKSFYSYIQSSYWNVGFLKYWTINNVPNFIFAIPNIVIMWYSSVYFSHQYPCSNLKPLILITRIFLVVIVFFAHIQIINRVSSFIPLHLWYLADRLIKKSTKKTKPLRGDDTLVKLYIYWLIYWIPVQTILFACFLPPA